MSRPPTTQLQWILGALLAALATGPLVATAAEPTVLPRLEPPRTASTAPQDAAVVIGIEDYVYLPNVPFARADAEAFHRFLTDTVGVPPERIKNLAVQPATRTTMLNAVRGAAQRVGPNGTLWIYFVGHGAPVVDASGDAVPYLIGHAATSDALQEASISQAELLQAARPGESARGTVVLIDACFSGLSRQGTQLTTDRFGGAVTLGAAPRTVVWTAAQANQSAGVFAETGHGLFTYFAVGALMGWAADEAGQVTVEGAQRYVERAMKVAEGVRSRPQEPHFGTPPDTAQWLLATVDPKAAKPDLRALNRLSTSLRLGLEAPPEVKPVEPFVPIRVGYQAQDPAALRLLETAIRADRDAGVPPEQKIGAWRAVADHPRTSAEHRLQADGRAARWRAFIEAERARDEQIRQIRARYTTDRAHLTQLLALGDDVAPAEQKRLWREEFARVWTPWRELVGDDPLLDSSRALSSLAATLAAGTGVLLYDGEASRTGAMLEVLGGYRWGGWSLQAGPVIGVEPPHPVIVRGVATGRSGWLVGRLGVQSMVHPEQTVGAVGGAGVFVPITSTLAAVLLAELTWWPRSSAVLPFEGRLGLAYGW